MKNFRFLFADLDDTLFQSLENARDQRCAASLPPFSRTAARSPTPPPRQRAFLAFAQDGMTMIPTTARNLDAFRRVRLPFTSYAVLNYGGVVLQPDGASTSPGWTRCARRCTPPCPACRSWRASSTPRPRAPATAAARA